jgi:hypothetical protein
MICIDCKIDKDDKHFRKYINKDGYSIQRHQCYSCLYIKQRARNEKKVAVLVSNEEPEILEVKGVTKKCAECEKVLPADDYYKSPLGTLFKYCKKCHVNKANEGNRNYRINNGGSTRVPVKPNVFADHVQQEQTHQFLQLLGWSFTDGVWWKEGIKTKDKVWECFNEKYKKKRVGHSNGGRKVLKIYTMKEQIIKEYEDGKGFFELADIYNCSHTTIRALVKDYYDKKGTN